MILPFGTQLVPFHFAAGVLLLSLVLAGVFTLEDAYKAVPVCLLLVIVGGSCLAPALEETGHSCCVRTSHRGSGAYGRLDSCLYRDHFLIGFLSMFINNSCCCHPGTHASGNAEPDPGRANRCYEAPGAAWRKLLLHDSP